MLRALDMRLHLSRRQYDWLRSKGQPLPSITTLQRWLADVKLRSGVCDLQVGLLKKMLTPLSERERQCTVMFDEMDLMQMMQYDPQLDMVVGPHRHLQVLMVGGIFSKWKMPVLFVFDKAVTATMLRSLIISVEAAGARVVSTVNDLGGSNQGLWRDLGIGHEKNCWFTNPADGNRYTHLCVRILYIKLLMKRRCS